MTRWMVAAVCVAVALALTVPPARDPRWSTPTAWVLTGVAGAGAVIGALILVALP